MFCGGADFSDYAPVDTFVARDFLMNNAAHMADQAGQVRVNWMVDDGSSGITVINVGSVGLSPYGRAIAFGPFPISIRDDGSSYRMRVRVRGYYNGGAGTGYYRLVLGGWSRSFADANLADVTALPNVKDLSVSSGTDGWITDASPVIYMNASQVADETRGLSVAGAAGGSAIYSARVCMVYLHVFAVADNNWALTGVYGAELRGED